MVGKLVDVFYTVRLNYEIGGSHDVVWGWHERGGGSPENIFKQHMCWEGIEFLSCITKRNHRVTYIKKCIPFVRE